MEALDQHDLSRATQFIEALMRQAHRDAEVTAELLRDLGVQREIADGTFESIGLPLEHLLGIGLAIRLRSWEINNITLHLTAGIPQAEIVLNKVLSDSPGPELSAFVTQTNLKAFSLYAQHFVWSGGDCDLQADLAIVFDEDERFLDHIVEFLCRDD